MTFNSSGVNIGIFLMNKEKNIKNAADILALDETSHELCMFFILMHFDIVFMCPNLSEWLL